MKFAALEITARHALSARQRQLGRQRGTCGCELRTRTRRLEQRQVEMGNARGWRTVPTPEDDRFAAFAFTTPKRLGRIDQTKGIVRSRRR